VAVYSLRQRLGAEFLGTAFLLATVIGSGIMGERLSGGNVAIALLGNTIPTGAILFVLITMLGPISGAHFNPAVTAVFAARRELSPSHAAGYVAVQMLGPPEATGVVQETEVEVLRPVTVTFAKSALGVCTSSPG